ncbi:hypothetical protein BDV41DRAFT_543017 [Aspergillus transmontanensis]|uniref:Uncharacterized protein n=1 Tax=Aspergillus transmontanensis TaxID=1034304 RepID=A0A5N6VRI0_9EURO|nr:hypothetical protein BDV41DRAFT_543017 [Aspergillus transmontanensis]
MHIIRRLYVAPSCHQIKFTSSNSSGSITTPFYRYASSKVKTPQDGKANSNGLVEDKITEKDVKNLEKTESSPESPSDQTSAEPKSSEGHQKYYSLKNYREGPNTESGGLGSTCDEEGVKAHNKDMKDRHDRY